MERSSYETLAARGANLVAPLLDEPDEDWQVRISLEKPTAIPLADAACVEIRADGRRR